MKSTLWGPVVIKSISVGRFKFKSWGLASALAALLWLSGCATTPSRYGSSNPSRGSESSPQTSKRQSTESSIDAPKTIRDILHPDILHPDISQKDVEASTQSVIAANPSEITVHGIKLKNTHFDYPVTINSKVEQWVDYFLGRGRSNFERYLERSELFIPFIQPILRQNAMPEDLVYLAMIESGFNNHAKSHAKAVGPWQFIAATGKRYGLLVNWWVDERRDTRKSTLAAAEYLKDLYGMFGNWELAAAAYNSGESKVARAIQRYGTRDFWAITRHRFLRPETRDYVPKIIAAALISKNRTQFGFPASYINPAQDEVISSAGEIVKVEKNTEPLGARLQNERTETLAAILREDEWVSTDDDAAPPGAVVAAHEPAVAQATSVGTVPVAIRPAKSVSTPHISKKGELLGAEVAEVEVQSPADLLRVATAAGLSYQTVKSLNPDITRWCTPPTVSTYRIKLPSSSRDRFFENYNRSDFPRRVSFLNYKVKKGENLQRIASRFGIKIDPMTDLNSISAKTPLRVGTQVILPIPNDRTRTLASLEVRDPPEHRRSRRAAKRGGSRINLKRRQAAARADLSYRNN